MMKMTCRTIVFSLGFLISACGSLTTHERHQFVLVQSVPNGAPIFYRGKKAGETPAFVEIRRAQHSSIQILDGDRVVNLPVSSRYRWDGSFWPNWVFFYFAPVGWIVDYATGSAWNMNDPSTPKLHMTPPPARSPPLPLVAIAPPQADSADVSDEGGLLWQKHLQAQYPNRIILPYKEKLDEFTTHGFDFDSTPGASAERDLFGRLAVNEIFESQVADTSQGIELRGHFRNVVTQKTSGDEAIRATPSQDQMTFGERFKTIIHLVPNTIGVEISHGAVVLSNGAGDHASVVSRDSTVFSQVAPYISALNFTRQIPPRREAAGKLNFEFVPAVRATYRRIQFPSLQEISSNEFSYLTVGAGLGPEIGWQWGPNYVYGNVVPIFGWHRLAWRSSDGLNVSSVGAVTLRAETGYLYYLNERFSLRFFLKETSTPDQIWNSAVQNIHPGADAVTSSTDLSTGFVFGYTWEPVREIHKWKIFN
jgi:hypothetical protein